MRSTPPLRILHLEDSRLDARLVEVHLKAAFPEAEVVVAGDRPTYEAALAHRHWDVVLADYMVPGFVGTEALHLARERHPDIPFIVVTGAIGEEAAVETLREGATDFLLKSRLVRLAPVIHRAIEENWKARERQAYLEALGQRVVSYRALANNMPHFVARLDPDLRFVFANRVWQEGLGGVEEDILGKTLEELGVEAALRSPLEAALQQAFRERGQVEALLEGPLDPARRVEVKVVPEPNAAGEVATVLVVGRDATQENQAHELLRLRADTYRSTFENSFLVAWIVDPTTGRIEEANAAAAAFYGYPKEAFKGMPLGTLTTLPEEKRRANLEQLIQGKALHFEAQHRLKNGELRHMEVFTSPLHHLDRPMAYAICHDITEQRKAEARLKDAQRMAHMGDWVMSFDTMTATVSDNLCRIYGFEPEDYPKDHAGFLALVHPDDREGVEAGLMGFARGGEDRTEFRFRILRPDGSLRHIQSYAEGVRDAGGRILAVKGTDLDVTERVEAERERDAHFLRLRNLQMALDEAAIWAITDRRGTITYANQLFSRVSGYAQEELVGQNHRILKSGRHPDAFFEDMWRTLRHAHIWKGVICNRAKDGHLYWVDTTIVPFTDTLGQPQEYLAIRFEITAQKEAEAALARVAEEREALLKATSVARAVPFSEEADGTLLFGPTALDVLGLGPEACPKTSGALKDLLEPEYWGDLAEVLVRADDDRARSFEAPFRTGQGALWTRWTMAQEGGRLKGVIQDITEAHRFQEQLLQSQKLESLGTLVGGIAHDFNNLLMAILGYTDVLRETEPSPEDLAKGLDTVHRAASRGRTLVSELLNFARRHPPTRAATDLNRLLEEVRHLLTRALPPTARLDLQLDPALPTVSADPSQLHQVVMNLALNARDALGGEGLITLRTGRTEVGPAEAEARGKQPGAYVFIDVEDTGSGMAPEVAARVFEPFFTTKPAGKGTGLGLSVAYGIVEGHGGILRCESQWGHGTRFSVLLPLALGRRESAGGEVRGVPIALLDDPGPHRKALMDLLKGLGHRPAAFEGSAPLREAHAEAPFRLLIVHPGRPEAPFLAALRLEDLDCPVLLLAEDPSGLCAPPGCTLVLNYPPRPYDLLVALDRLLP